MNKSKEEKLKRFVRDELMCEAVYDVILSSFMKIKDKDVNVLASQMLAIDLLKDSWETLVRYKNDTQEEGETPTQIGM